MPNISYFIISTRWQCRLVKQSREVLKGQYKIYAVLSGLKYVGNPGYPARCAGLKYTVLSGLYP